MLAHACGQAPDLQLGRIGERGGQVTTGATATHDQDRGRLLTVEDHRVARPVAGGHVTRSLGAPGTRTPHPRSTSQLHPSRPPRARLRSCIRPALPALGFAVNWGYLPFRSGSIEPR